MWIRGESLRTPPRRPPLRRERPSRQQWPTWQWRWQLWAHIGWQPWACAGGRPRPSRDTGLQYPLLPTSRAQGHCSRRLLTRCLSSWRRRSVSVRPDQPSEATSQPCGLPRTSACFRGPCEPSTGGPRNHINRRPDNLIGDHAGSVFSGHRRHRRKSKPWQPLLASASYSSSESPKRCRSHRQARRALPWSYSSLPRSAVTRECGGRFMGGADLGSVSSGPVPKPVASLKLSCWFGVELRQRTRSSQTSSATPRLVGIDGTTYGGEPPRCLPPPPPPPPDAPKRTVGGWWARADLSVQRTKTKVQSATTWCGTELVCAAVQQETH